MDILLSLWIPWILFVPSIVAEKPSGLTLKLVHIDSPESPYYQANHTYTQRLERLAKLSKARALHLSRRRYINATYDSQVIRGVVDVQAPFIFMVEIAIGTIPPGRLAPEKYWYFLQFDTGSDLIWLQCADCRAQGNHCYNQARPLFPARLSQSYNPIPCNRQSCFTNRCKDKYCKYYQEYEDDASSEGYLAYERFTFPSSTGAREESLQLLFGCGYDQKNFPNRVNRAAGILGMGVSHQFHSFPDQIKTQSNGVFSYCVPSMDNAGRVPPSWLQFGADIPKRRNLRSTRIYIYPKENPYYYLQLIDLSVNGQRLNVPWQYFARRSNGNGGCLIDSGNSYSALVPQPFYSLTEAITPHLLRLIPRLSVRSFEQYGLHFCFESPQGVAFQQLPRMAFHFDGGADLEIKPENLFLLLIVGNAGYYCLGISRADDGINVIGAKQQVDQRFVYDLSNLRLQFGPEKCNNNPSV